MSPSRSFPKPEVMSPAGHWPQLHAAIEAGADAVYFGLQHFTARAKVGFTLDELPEAMRTLRSRGVKGYVTFNTLVFDRELDEAARTLAKIAEAGADSIIVQDIGVAQLAKRIAPELDVHGSTQMSLSSAEGIRLAQSFGVSRVVLARELSLEEIRLLRAGTDCELEMFVHGALCVSYSGQCFSSEAWGGRSANRGQCAQACRLPYEMIVDDRLVPLGDARYLLSPGDLMTLEQIPEIVNIGVSALKIEGRYKDAEYVALTTQAYRKAVDAAWNEQPSVLEPAERLKLEQVYSRGLAPHFVTGTNHQTVVQGRFPRHRGVHMGAVVKVLDESVLVSPEPGRAASPLKPGDGVVFDAADWRSPQEPEEGGRIFEVRAAGKNLELAFGNGAIDFTRIRPGDWLWRTHDPELEREARPFTQASHPVRKQPIRFEVVARAGEKLGLRSWLVEHPEVGVTVQSTQPLGPARNRPLDLEVLREQLGRLGQTAYELAGLELRVDGQPFAPVSVLNELRREAVSRLAEMQSKLRPVAVNDPELALRSMVQPAPSAAREGAEDTTSLARPGFPPPHGPPDPTPRASAPTAWPVTLEFEALAPTPHLSPGAGEQAEAFLRGQGRLDSMHRGAPSTTVPSKLEPQLHLVVRTPDHLDTALELRPASVTLDYLDLYGLRPAVERAQASGVEVRVASPRVLKPGEERIVQFLLDLGSPILVRSTGLLQALRQASQGRPLPRLFGDFSLNAANVLSARTFLDLGLERLTPTHDLNAAQIAELARSTGAERFEVVAFHHLPVFHTEHCVFCRFLSTGTSYKDCGRPCESHRVALRDEHGREHPVLADVGCRNTVFGAEAQEGSRHLGKWLETGLRHFRLEFVHETPKELRSITQAFDDALTGRVPMSELTRRLRKLASHGTTEGSLFIPVDDLRLTLA